MIRYTVTYTNEALALLTRIWLASSDRQSITQAGDNIDRILRDDAQSKGIAVGSSLRQLVVVPLVVEFAIEEADRLVTIWSVRHIANITNGH